MAKKRDRSKEPFTQKKLIKRWNTDHPDKGVVVFYEDDHGNDILCKTASRAFLFNDREAMIGLYGRAGPHRLDRVRPAHEKHEAKKESMLSITLPTGVKIEGSGPELSKVLETLGVKRIDDGAHYTSTSKGVIKISDMATPHIRNAICKMYREWADDLSVVKDTQKFTSMMRNGPSDKTMMALIKELATRKD